MVATVSKSQPILIVEDSDDDYEATDRALRHSGNLLNPLLRCRNGQEALDFVYRQGHYNAENAPRPGLILLDLNMPGIDGREVLIRLKSDAELKDIPVIVLTTSSDERDIEECYKDGANTYITKPVELDGFFKAIERLKEYWLEIAILPKSGH
ncbi:MAG: response regulator [Halioglobus sp.]